MHRNLWNMLPWSVALAASISLAACGEVTVTPLGATDVPNAADAAIESDGDVSAPLDSADVLLPVDATDTAGDECVTDFDCLGLTDKPACVLPHCANGTCKLGIQPEGAVCIDSAVPNTDCTASRCNATGVCGLLPVPDGKPCGFGSCGKKCQAGTCIAATDLDYDDGNLCTKDFCDQGILVVHQPITDLNTVCDDGDACTSGDTCLKGKCTGSKKDCGDGIACTADACDGVQGCVHTAEATLCESGACAIVACDLSAGCTVTGTAIGKACDDGDPCTQGDKCAGGGQCGGTATCACVVDSDCKTTNLCLGAPSCLDGKCVNEPDKAVLCSTVGDGPCTATTCVAATGLCTAVAAVDGKPCDDGDACTSASACKAGACASLGATDCDDNTACTADSCNGSSGCVHAPTSGACDDGNACTIGDHCLNGGCTGQLAGCDDQINCTLDQCEATTGSCSHTANAAPCDDSNPCTVDTCDIKQGCLHSASDTAKCSDGDACTEDSCKAGKCVSQSICECKADLDCNDQNPCTADGCAQGKCVYTTTALDGKACDGGDKCQTALSGSCAAGTCKSGNSPKDCKDMADACNAAVCNPATGKCEAVAKSDGAGCDADGNGCTVGDACKSGKCLAGMAASCVVVGDACNTGACKSGGPAQFTCEKQPTPAGTVCEDSKFCTISDKCDGKGACLAGGAKSCADVSTPCNPAACSDSAGKCVAVAAASTAPCDDGLYCTAGDHCDGKGACSGGAPMVCAGGTCLVGQCDESKKTCSKVTAALGAVCNDGNACTTLDACNTTGQCAGGQTKTCAGDACNAGTCNPTTGACGLTPQANGLACSDGLPCTVNDTCVAGKCAAGLPKSCAGDACHIGVCDATTGSCGLQPTSLGTPCDDGNACTAKDQCDQGACKGTYTCACKPATGAVDCNDNNPCTSDTCALSGSLYKCSNAPQSGAKCDDGNACTSGDVCSATGACAGKAVVCNDNNACTVDSCSGGTCGSTPNPGIACNDTNACTLTDVCSTTGTCAGTPVSCEDGNTCTDDSCDPVTGSCKNSANTYGCSDSNACTLKDACLGGKCIAGTQVDCNDENPCTSDSCSIKTGACSHVANSSACSDGNACTINDVCASAVCQPGKSVTCNDGNLCTDDVCDTVSGACKAAYNAAACSDGNACTVGDVCKFGGCASGSFKKCTDFNVCTNDSCDAGTGNCVYTPNAIGCSDGNACTSGDYCSAGACNSGGAIGCTDTNSCTVDKCDTVLGCTHTPTADGKTCGVSKKCTAFPICYAVPTCFGGLCEPANCADACFF